MIKLKNKENYNYVILLVIIVIGALVRLKDLTNSDLMLPMNII